MREVVETTTFKLVLDEPGQPRDRTPRIHMEGGWDQHGPFGICGKYPASARPGEPHRQVMTLNWSLVTCRGCLRSKPKETP